MAPSIFASLSEMSEPGEIIWKLGDAYFAKVNLYQGYVLTHLREYYLGYSGKRKPGKKGIALRFHQLEILVAHVKVWFFLGFFRSVQVLHTKPEAVDVGDQLVATSTPTKSTALVPVALNSPVQFDKNHP
jgi:hypothetical protein